jgi:hypothetical protein
MTDDVDEVDDGLDDDAPLDEAEAALAAAIAEADTDESLDERVGTVLDELGDVTRTPEAVARFLDADGRGLVDLNRFKCACRMYHISPVHIKNAQTDPTARKFIETVPEHGIMYYRSLAAVGEALNCTVGTPVLVDVHSLCKRKFKPTLYVEASRGGDGSAL